MVLDQDEQTIKARLKRTQWYLGLMLLVLATGRVLSPALELAEVGRANKQQR